MSETPIEWTPQTETGEPAQNAQTPQTIVDQIDEILGGSLDRVLTVPEGYTGPEIPYGPTVAGKYLRWGAGGTSIIAGTPSGGGGGGATTAVDSIADLTAMLSTDLTPGQMVYVKSRDGVEPWGAGWFRWDDLATDATDGGVTFVPDDLTAVATPESVSYNSVDGPNRVKSLAHSQVVWGSVALTYNVEASTLGSEWLHGHTTLTSNDPTSGVINARAMLDHGLGHVNGNYYRTLGNIINSNTNTGATYDQRHTTISYSYCTGAGRWKRVLEGGFVTPQMFGAQPNDETFDCSQAICWAINYIRDHDDVDTLWYDAGTCYIFGFWGELIQGLTQKGNGPGHCVVKYRGQQVVGAGVGGLLGGGVIDHVRAANYAHDGVGFPTAFDDPYRLMDVYRPGQTQFDKADQISFVDGYVDGNAANNMYFTLDTGQVSWTRSQVSQFLRESPMCTGFNVTNESGRQYKDDGRFYVDGWGWRDMLGSCWASAGAGKVYANNSRNGPSLSGRIGYGMQGWLNNVTYEGNTRSSFWAPYSAQATNVKIVNERQNPWKDSPDWDQYPAGLGFRGDNRENDIPGTALAYQREGLRGVEIIGIEIENLPGAMMEPIFHWSGEGFNTSNFNVRGPIQAPVSTLLQRDGSDLAAGVPQGSAGIKLSNGKYHHRGLGGVTVLDDSAVGLIEDGLLRDIHIIETFAEPVVWTYSHDLTQSVWTKTGLAGTPVTTASGTQDELHRDILCKIYENSSNSIHAVDRAYTTTTGKTYIFDFEVSGTTGRDCYVYISGIGYAFFDLSAGVFDYVDTTLTVEPVLEPENNLYRCAVKFKETSGQSRTFRFGLANGATAISCATYTGDGSSYLVGGALHVRQHRSFIESHMQFNTEVLGSSDTGGQANSYVFLPYKPNGFLFNITADVDATPTQGLHVPQQHVRIENIYAETWFGRIGRINGSEQANTVRTLIEINGGRAVTTSNKWFETDAHVGTDLMVNTTIQMRGVEVMTYDPNITYVGDNTDWGKCIAKVIMEGCFTADNRRSEFSQVVTLTVVSSSPGANQVLDTTMNSTGYLFTTPLFWSPLSYGIEPLSAKAIACKPAIAPEITGGNYSAPGLRITVGTSVTAGDVLTFRIHGAVAPSRAL